MTKKYEKTCEHNFFPCHTLRNMEYVTPCSSWNSASSSRNPCWFSSQVPRSFSFDGFLKFVEEHHEFLRQEWLHDVKLGELKLSTTWPFKRMFSCMENIALREIGSCLVAATIIKYIIPWNTKNKVFFGFIFLEKFKKQMGNCELKGLIYIFNMQLNACSMKTFYVLFAKCFLFF